MVPPILCSKALATGRFRYMSLHLTCLVWWGPLSALPHAPFQLPNLPLRLGASPTPPLSPAVIEFAPQGLSTQSLALEDLNVHLYRKEREEKHAY
jgi:hypothetical protein